MPSLKGILHGRVITTDAGHQQQEGGGGGLRRSNAVKHHGQQQQQQASAGTTLEERYEFPRRGVVRTNTAPGIGSGAHGPTVVNARARATTSAAAQPGSEWSYVPVNAKPRQYQGLGPSQREQLERHALDNEHDQRTQRWVADQQKRMELTQPVTRQPLPVPPRPPQSQLRPGPQMQQQQRQQPQPTIPSSGNRRPFFKNDMEVDACVRSTSSYEVGILNQGDWRTGKSVHPVQARRPVHVVTPSQCPVSRVASPVDEISDQREATRRVLRRRDLPDR
ncbi:hypothetical protein BO82DRAFT_405239 [Aspergillus uvarum CBS 121591]|uniref:Uncharacterized protein n=1 Tax=Aspergillus uvarum CBS 121591 TaxID=1448315 RepID=A0A319BXG4_9EURO|nr:hypothetical protein BO82DRAFT_405239 [Aspergillus uvarum CBS 121591]PYH78386.1 hypothetical protein BO82DRAFT_405239 [Aspergillus uvarum CBS 121591]